MSTLKAFTSIKDNLPALKNALTGVQTSVAASYQLVSGGVKSSEFSNQVTTLVASDEFMSQLSENIGEPKTEESEDEFVDRATETMRQLLKSKLK